ncbi:hypothetical protein ACYOEI_30645 [Singulisphaera rosea]
MHIYPVDEQQIADFEQGRRCETVVPLPSDATLQAGDTILFAHSTSRPGQPPNYIRGGDSIVISLTGVTDLESTDPATGRALVQLSWKPLGRQEPSEDMHSRAGKSRRSRGGE